MIITYNPISKRSKKSYVDSTPGKVVVIVVELICMVLHLSHYYFFDIVVRVWGGVLHGLYPYSDWDLHDSGRKAYQTPSKQK